MKATILFGDRQLYFWLHQLTRSKAFASLMRIVTIFGETSVGVVYFFIMVILANVNNNEVALKGAMGMLVSQMIVHTIKRVVHRRRPYTTMDVASVNNPPKCIYSFPSGHTACAFSVALGVSKMLPELTFIMFFLAILTGLSRIALGYHYPTDVIFGAIIAIIW